MQLQAVNEKSTAYLTVTFRDMAGAAQAPASATYRIDDVASGVQVRAMTAISPVASSVEVHLTPDDNTLLVADSPAEQRRVTVIAQYGQGDEVTAEFIYKVVNLRGVT